MVHVDTTLAVYIFTRH